MAVTLDVQGADQGGSLLDTHRGRVARQGLTQLVIAVPAVAAFELAYYLLAARLGWYPLANQIVSIGVVVATTVGLGLGVTKPFIRQMVWQALIPILIAQAFLIAIDFLLPVGPAVLGRLLPFLDAKLIELLGSSKLLLSGIAVTLAMIVALIAGVFHRIEGRQVIWQTVLVIGLVLLAEMIVSNTWTNLKKQNVASGFRFLDLTAGFPIGQRPIEYTIDGSTYGRAFIVGFVNTLIVAAIGIVLATILGFVMGIARLSTNWLIARLATVYVEIVRNIPLLLQLFVWYFALFISNLPEVNDPIRAFGGFLTKEGMQLPYPTPEPGFWVVPVAMALGIIVSVMVVRWANERQRRTGQPFPVISSALAITLGLPLLAFLVAGRPMHLEYPIGHNLSGGGIPRIEGGLPIQTEFLAVVLGLVFYTGGFIAEIVRAGIVGVSKGQKEAGRALGLPNARVLRLVVIPQAMRIVIPPLTSQYLNLTKNSSLGVAIAYPDLFSVGGTIINQNNQAVEVIIIIMAVYLTLSLLTSLFMNWFNARMALVER